MRPIILLLSLAATLSICAAEKKPNILLLFADDLGRYASAFSDQARRQAFPDRIAPKP